ncbi:MAG: hypothetical protein ABEJ65_10845 [bacterium]
MLYLLIKWGSVLLLVGMCGGAGFAMIYDPELGSRVGYDSVITVMYEHLPAPWDLWFMRGCGTIILIITLLIFIGAFFIR